MSRRRLSTPAHAAVPMRPAKWLAMGLAMFAGVALAQPTALDAGLRERIDRFVESEQQASGIPGLALAIVQDGQIAHVRGLSTVPLNRPVG